MEFVEGRKKERERAVVVIKITECFCLVFCKHAAGRQLGLDSLLGLSSSFLWGFLGGRLFGGWLCLLDCWLCCGLLGGDLLCGRLLGGWLLGLHCLLRCCFGSLLQQGD